MATTVERQQFTDAVKKLLSAKPLPQAAIAPTRTKTVRRPKSQAPKAGR